MTLDDPAGLTGALRRIAREAGDLIMRYYEGGATVRIKADSTPVTEADEAAERLIVAALETLTPEIPVVAEESAAAGAAPDVAGRAFWLVDPLDGTKEFIGRNGEFTVNIALIEGGRPVLGVVRAPVAQITHFAHSGAAFVERDDGAPRPIHARFPATDGLVAVVSRSHRSPETDRFLADYSVKEERSAGSSLKFGLIAAGEADIYPRLGRTMEWDTAAGHAVVAAAGASVRTLDGADLVYGKPGFENPYFVVRGRER
ncbi:MAG: 3'(2'),5'-bisphosphate nucleotidase CysQ [Alphaproteobacteria bacterium]